MAPGQFTTCLRSSDQASVTLGVSISNNMASKQLTGSRRFRVFSGLGGLEVLWVLGPFGFRGPRASQAF